MHHYVPVMKLEAATETSLEDRKETTMNITRAYSNWRKYRQTITELGRMSNRELNDLGIQRDDIRSVARQAAR
jgi:uncharacterized protein YjiS (DUF1127 family)